MGRKVTRATAGAASRPARHTMALGSESNALVTCEFVAVFG